MNLAQMKTALETSVKNVLTNSLDKDTQVTVSYDANNGGLGILLRKDNEKKDNQSSFTVYSMYFKEEGQEFIPSEEADYSELRWGKHKEKQNIFYLHGALHLFDMFNEIVKQEYDGKNYLMEQIQKLMNKGTYPIFVTAGNGDEKLNHIKHNYYLAYCYDSLCNISGSLITYGFNFGEYDEHIIKAINKAAGQNITKKLWSVYIGVYSEDDKKHIESIESKFKCKVHIFDSKTAKIWDNI